MPRGCRIVLICSLAATSAPRRVSLFLYRIIGGGRSGVLLRTSSPAAPDPRSQDYDARADCTRRRWTSNSRAVESFSRGTSPFDQRSAGADVIGRRSRSMLCVAVREPSLALLLQSRHRAISANRLRLLSSRELMGAQSGAPVPTIARAVSAPRSRVCAARLAGLALDGSVTECAQRGRVPPASAVVAWGRGDAFGHPRHAAAAAQLMRLLHHPAWPQVLMFASPPPGWSKRSPRIEARSLLGMLPEAGRGDPVN